MASALIDSLQTYIINDEGLQQLNDMLEFAGVLCDVDPSSISTYQIEGAGTMINGNAVPNCGSRATT